MRINNNISAMNTYSRLNSANNAKSGSLSKLSSGLRINRAGDDAAGLAISEKMRGQIGGLKQATRNAQDGISLIQTAEGALNETHSILNRMRELAVQSANDTNTNDDRKEIQNEMNELSGEITRISSDTQFNTQNLLDGSIDDTTFHIGANKNQKIELQINDMSAKGLGLTLQDKMEGSSNIVGTKLHNVEITSGNSEVKEIKFVDNAGFAEAKGVKIIEEDGTLSILAAQKATVKSINDALAAAGYDDMEITATKEAGGGTGILATDDTVEIGVTTGTTDAIALDKPNVKVGVLENIEVKVTNKEVKKLDFVAHNTESTLEVKIDKAGEVEVSAGADIKLKEIQDKLKEMGIELTSSSEGGTAVGTIDAAGVNIDTDPKNGPIRVDTQDSANEAIKTIDGAIAKVSAERSKLGATQNRLDHTINNLTATAENLSEAESRIRDVDMAEEMMEFTKNNILSQAATSMLAQANQMPQSVLQLLQ